MTKKLAYLALLSVWFALPASSQTVAARQVRLDDGTDLQSAVDAGELGGGGGLLDFCRDGSQQGIGYDSASGRWAQTCGWFNWHGWTDPTQATASYYVDCTGDGTPHSSCLHEERRLIGGHVHRLAIAAQYTQDGGCVVLPNFPNRDHAISVDDGAGVLEGTATRAAYPEPYDPEWEGRPEFAQLGYPTMLTAITLTRGVKLCGESRGAAIESDPGDATVAIHRPRLRGTWLVDDRGNAPGGPGAGGVTLDGPGASFTPITQYRITAGGNRYTPYCSTTSTTDASCDAAQNSPEFLIPAPSQLYGIDTGVVSDIVAGTNAACVSDTVSGAGQTTATGVCRGNRLVRCWATSGTNTGRDVGGCIFDTDTDGDFSSGDAGNLNLGVCDSMYDALEYDSTVRKQDLLLGLNLSQCSTTATSSADCQVLETGHHIWYAPIRDGTGSWGGTTGLTCGTGGRLVEMGPRQNSYPLPFRRFYIGSGTVNRIVVTTREKLDDRESGLRDVALMPADWLGRSTCLSGNDQDNGDDEAACDTDTVLGFGSGANHLAERVLGYKLSQATGSKSAIWDHFGGSKNNNVRDSVVDANYRAVTVDWGNGVLERTRFSRIGSEPPYGPVTSVFSCFTSSCISRRNEFETVYGANLYQTGQTVMDVRFEDNTYRAIRLGGGALYPIISAQDVLIQGERYEGIWGGSVMDVLPGALSAVRPKIVWRNSSGMVELPATSSRPVAAVRMQSYASDTTRDDRIESLVIDGIQLNASNSDGVLLWIEDNGAGDAAAETKESSVNVSVTNSSIDGPGAPEVVSAGSYRTGGSGEDANSAASRDILGERFIPYMSGNRVNGQPSALAEWPHRSFAAADVPNGSGLPDGFTVAIYDDDLSSPCASSGGSLVGDDGDPTLRLCTWDGSGWVAP